MVDDYGSEIEMADRAVALNPNSFFAWFNRGWVYEIAGLPEEAVRSFERAIRMSPIDPLLHIAFAGIGHAFVELHRFDEAIVYSATIWLRSRQSASVFGVACDGGRPGPRFRSSAVRRR
jgi:tetratricopeptide (TPR) repeat protein